jgi:hypothetical protein
MAHFDRLKNDNISVIFKIDNLDYLMNDNE